MKRIYRFKSSDKYEVTGRGTAYSITGDQIPPGMYDPDHLRGQQVHIDGELYTVKGVETFCIPRSESSPYRGGFGLLV